jgi:hypothetical protein
MVETTSKEQRKHSRYKAPKGMLVIWQAVGHRAVSHVENLGMGGLFLHTPNPPAQGSSIGLIFELKTGKIRARAVVRNSKPGEGMGVQIIQMEPTDRFRLNQFLSQHARTQPDAGC